MIDTFGPNPWSDDPDFIAMSATPDEARKAWRMVGCLALSVVVAVIAACCQGVLR